MADLHPADRLVVPLSRLNAEALPWAGGKGAQLGALLAGGLPVPEGFCVTTGAFCRGMDAQVRTEITAAYRDMGGGAVAVRSSATAEDLPEASFAGQQESFLNITGGEEVVEAVRACWQSLRTERAVAYRRDRGIAEESVAMAVVVERMVQAEAAGVLFTLNPVTGALDEIVIEAARGLGDQVVSARVTPDRYRLRRRAPHEVLEARGEATGDLLGSARLAELAQLGLAAERLLGRAADIEWALAGGRLYLLQARAVTAAGPRPPEVHFGSRWNAEHCRGRLTLWANHNVREAMPYPHTPFSWSFWNYLVFPQISRVLGVLGRAENIDDAPNGIDLVEGRIYLNTNVMAGFMSPWLTVKITRAADAEAGACLEESLAKGELIPVRRPWSLLRTVRLATHLTGQLLRKTRPAYAWKQLHDARAEVGAFARINLGMLGDETLLALARYLAAENLPRSLEALAAGCLALPALPLLSWLLHRWGLEETLPPLLSGGRGNPTMETALALWDVAAGAGPEVRAVFSGHAIADVPRALGESAAGRQFLARLEVFLGAHGHRAVREFDFSCPRWREDPAFVYETLRNFLAHPPGQPTPREHYERQVSAHEDAKAAVHRGLTWHPLRRRIFRGLVRVLEERLPLREAYKFYLLIGVAHIRGFYLEVAGRMAERGVLEKQEDFFYLSIPEIERLAAGELDAAWVREQIPLRRLQFARQMRAHPPLLVRSDGKPAVQSQTVEGALRGTPVSWGTACGPVRVLLDPADGALLRPGEILVAPFTDPGWTPLFLTAGALIMEVGGIMSHGAVVAREYGLPAVVGVKHATRLLNDGELVEVNGATGEVARVTPAPSPVASNEALGTRLSAA